MKARSCQKAFNDAAIKRIIGGLSHSFKHTVQLWLTWGQQTQAVGIEVDEELLFILIAQKKVGNRSGRVEPRAVKQRPKPFSLLMERREQAREKIKK